MQVLTLNLFDMKKALPILQPEADHNPQWSAPEALVDMF